MGDGHLLTYTEAGSNAFLMTQAWDKNQLTKAGL